MCSSLNNTVSVNKEFTFHFKKMITLRLTVLSKNGTTTERKCNGHTIQKRNGTYKKRNRMYRYYTSAKQFSRVSVTVFE